jgi:mannose-6-phosphate isomerase class I
VDANSYPNPFSLKEKIESVGSVSSLHLFGKNNEFKFNIQKGEMNNALFAKSPSETWFYQIKGNLSLNIGDSVLHLADGESYVLPPNLEYHISRDSNSVGIVLSL